MMGTREIAVPKAKDASTSPIIMVSGLKKRAMTRGITETQTGNALAVDEGRQHDLLKGARTDGTVLTHALGVQKDAGWPVGR
jgi:hypothetical protein